MEQFDFLLVFTGHKTKNSQTESESAQPATNTTATAVARSQNEEGIDSLKDLWERFDNKN